MVQSPTVLAARPRADHGLEPRSLDLSASRTCVSLRGSCAEGQVAIGGANRKQASTVGKQHVVQCARADPSEEAPETLHGTTVAQVGL